MKDIKELTEKNPAQTAFIKEVAGQVLVMLLPIISNLIKTATNSTISDTRISELSPKDPLEYFTCLKGCENDSDCDGVTNDKDKCPNEGAPEGGCVTLDGCPDTNCDGTAD